MRIFINAVLLISLVLIAAHTAYSREWRGIVPLRSTRSDVIRLLNQCEDQKEACRFTLEKEDVHILFSGGLGTEYGCTKKVEPETVMFIGVKPKAKLKFKDLRLDKRNSRSLDVGFGLKGYATPDGLVVSVFKQEVLQLNYIVDEVNREFCGNYYDAQSFAELPQGHGSVYMDGLSTASAGDIINIRAHSFFNEKRGYTWTLSAGKLTAGQYTNKISIHTTGLAGQTIIVSAEIGDGLGHYVTGYHTVQIRKN